MAKLSIEEVAWVASQYWNVPPQISGGEDSAVVRATAIAMAESGGDAGVVNRKPPDLSYGLWQINMLGDMGPQRRKEYNLASNEDLLTPSTNARVAHGIQQSQGWGAWTTFTNGAYKDHLSAARKAWDNKKQPGAVGGGSDQTEYEGTALTAIANAVLEVAKAIFKGAVWLADPHNWVRVALVGTGGALVVGALVIVAKPNTSPVAAVTKLPKAAGRVAAAPVKAGVKTAKVVT